MLVFVRIENLRCMVMRIRIQSDSCATCMRGLVWSHHPPLCFWGRLPSRLIVLQSVGDHFCFLLQPGSAQGFYRPEHGLETAVTGQTGPD